MLVSLILFLVRIGYLLSKASQLMVKKVGTFGLMIGQGQIKALWKVKSGDQVSQMACIYSSVLDRHSLTMSFFGQTIPAQDKTYVQYVQCQLYKSIN